MHKSFITIKEELFCRVCGRDINFKFNNAVHSSSFNQQVCYKCIEKNSKEDNDHKTFYMTIPEVTELEHDVIMNGIGKSDFFDDWTNGIVWSDVVIEECEKTTPLQISGVVSSLVKKGLLLSNGTCADATLQLTAEGYSYYLSHKE